MIGKNKEMAKLVFDIETVGEDFDAADETTKELLTRWIKKESKDEAEYRAALDDLKNDLGFSPLTGEIVAVGVFDPDKNQGAVYFQSPGKKSVEFSEGGIKFKPMTEKEMLENFWQGAKNYDEFVSFNGRAFDVPFLMVRSAVNKVKPTVNLMPYRYATSARYPDEVVHIDLFDQLTFQGAVKKKGSLHMWSRAFGIKSPKSEGVTGDDVGRLFKEKKYEDIARYNVGDLRATAELYDYWQKYFKF